MPIDQINKALEAGRIGVAEALEVGQFQSLLDFYEAVTEAQERRLPGGTITLH